MENLKRKLVWFLKMNKVDIGDVKDMYRFFFNELESSDKKETILFLFNLKNEGKKLAEKAETNLRCDLFNFLSTDVANDADDFLVSLIDTVCYRV